MENESCVGLFGFGGFSYCGGTAGAPSFGGFVDRNG